MKLVCKPGPAISRWFICLCMGCRLGGPSLSAQEIESIYQIIQLDSITIRAEKEGFDIDDFIDLVIRDKSFYEAFQHLRTIGYTFQNEILMLDRKMEKMASYQSMARQYYKKPCRYMTEETRDVQGRFFTKKGDYKYYTAKLYDRMFFTQDTVCIPEGDPAFSVETDPEGMEKHVLELKKLIFNPGKKANVPLIGNKTAIFEKEMWPYYDYSIGSDTLEGQPSYVFTVQTKKEYLLHNPGKTVIKNLQTWFAKGSLQILKRKYTLAANTLLYHFNVNMDIDLIKTGEFYYPQMITYDGIWKVASKKMEHAKFKIRFSQFKND
ncbi:MAG: hypothetical protein SH818_03910 [Saprospiraceae bacterium]|nr:hypothetical protein [Saprospiraceae bacterium]